MMMERNKVPGKDAMELEGECSMLRLIGEREEESEVQN